MDKDTLRQTIIDKRLSYSVLQRAPWDKVIFNQVMDRVSIHKKIGLYASTRGEVDTYEIMNTLWLDGYEVYLPKIIEQNMEFYKVESFEDLKPGHFDILEPISTTIVDKNELDIIFVPLVVYNNDNYRIGYGKGYYDKYLHNYSGLKIGLAYSYQHTDETFQEEWDIPCDVILTEDI